MNDLNRCHSCFPHSSYFFFICFILFTYHICPGCPISFFCFVHTKVASSRRPEFRGVPTFPVSYYAREYAGYVGASRFTVMQASDSGLTVSGRHKVWCDTEVRTWIESWLRFGWHGISVLRSVSSKVYFPFVRWYEEEKVYEKDLSKIVGRLDGQLFPSLVHRLSSFVVCLASCISLGALILECMTAIWSFDCLVLPLEDLLFCEKSNFLLSRHFIGWVITSRLHVGGDSWRNLI